MYLHEDYFKYVFSSYKVHFHYVFLKPDVVQHYFALENNNVYLCYPIRRENNCTGVAVLNFL